MVVLGQRWAEITVAKDGLSVYVNDSNPLSELTMDQLEQIFTGKVDNWKQVDGPDARIIPYARENSSGTYVFFKEHVLQNADYTPTPEVRADSAAGRRNVFVVTDPSPQGAPGSGTLSRMFRVLVVDDDRDINEVVQDGLRAAGYDVAGALTGEEALAEVARRCPDLVLLDQMLPDIDGAEVCRRLRAAPQTRRVPIMFVSARAGQDARVGGLALGADDYVVKPFSMRELVLRVGAVLRRATPFEMKLPPEWVRLRDQFRVWNRYAEIHLARGEWRDCLELSRSILHSCDAALGPDERRRINERIARCAQELGDGAGQKSRPSKADRP